MLRLELGREWGLLPLLVAAPAVAAALGGMLYTLAVGALSAGGLSYFVLDAQPGTETHRGAVFSLVAAAGVTAAGLLACWIRARRDRELDRPRLVELWFADRQGSACSRHLDRPLSLCLRG